MSRFDGFIKPEIAAYAREMSLREPDVLRRLREKTALMPNNQMQIGPEQGQLMALLLAATGAKRTLEIGTFTGYSALWTALALPPEGRLTACDVSDEWTAVGREFWKEAGVAHKIDLRLGPALATLDSLLAQGDAGAYDFAFIDADKPNYDGYYERVLQLLRKGGLILIDNVLWDGKVLEGAGEPDANTAALRALNAKLKSDERVWLSLLPIGDGVTMAVKR